METSISKLFTTKNGLVHIYGQSLSTHPEFTWLYCATDIHKALVARAEALAMRKGEDVAKAVEKARTRKPGMWIQRNKSDTPEAWKQTIAAAAKETLRNNFGEKDSTKEECLLNFRCAMNNYELRPSDSVIKTTRGRNGATYVSQQLIIAYCQWTSPKFAAHVRQLFLDFAHGRQHLHDELANNNVRSYD